jgi:hypothetical protein
MAAFKAYVLPLQRAVYGFIMSAASAEIYLGK